MVALVTGRSPTRGVLDGFAREHRDLLVFLSFPQGICFYLQADIIHTLPQILSGPIIFLAIDTPRRDPKDIIFVNAEDGTPEGFIGAVSST